MALFDKSKKPFSYEIIREGDDVVLSVNLEDYQHIPSIEDNALVMSKACDMLIEVRDATKLVFLQKRNYEYDYSQVSILKEIASLYVKLAKRKDAFSYNTLLSDASCSKWANAWYSAIQDIISNLLRSDPIGAYVELVRISREERIKAEKSPDEEFIKCSVKYSRMLEYIISVLEETKLIALVKPYLAGHNIGNREIYRRVFTASIRPDFMFAKVMASFPHNGEEIDHYMVGNDIEITLFELPETVQSLYHVMPPEFKLSEEKYEILDTARKIMSEHKPTRSEFVEPDRMRQVFLNVGSDLIDELASQRGINLASDDIEQLAEILVRYTVGFGLIEVLLQDEKIQDITVNNQGGDVPMFVVHQDYGECRTNIIPTLTEAESWATKLRLISGRPLDEANPVLDTEITIKNANARVAAVGEPLNPFGLAYAFRRHRDKPWTLPLFVDNRMISPLAAGLLSFLIDGNRTLLVAGTRSAGKTSLLGSMLVEVMRKYRIITIEDTLELPASALRKLGYNIQPLKVAAALAKGSAEVPADEGIRTTLRMGDSALIVGEIRSKEALALYEAMRVGALANVVAGTIHGDSPYGVFDRVVNDLEVPRTSFKATDIIIVANPIKTPDGLHRWRRVTQITEVRKQWESDPLIENGFVDLMKYDTKTDQLEPTDALINGDSEILKAIAGNVKEWAGSWDAVWDNIMLRSKIKETIVAAAKKAKGMEILEAGFVVESNDAFHKISDKIRQETGKLNSKRIFFEWNEWLRRIIKKKSIQEN